MDSRRTPGGEAGRGLLACAKRDFVNVAVATFGEQPPGHFSLAPKFHKGMGQGNVGDRLDFCHLQYPQIGLPLVEPIERIVVRTQVRRQPAMPAKGAVEHPTQCDPSTVPAWTPNPIIRRVY